MKLTVALSFVEYSKLTVDNLDGIPIGSIKISIVKFLIQNSHGVHLYALYSYKLSTCVTSSTYKLYKLVLNQFLLLDSS